VILSDKDIKKELKKGVIIITPPPDLSVQLSSCSLDLRLSNQFTVFQHGMVPFIDVKKELPKEFTRTITLHKDSQHFIVQPGEFVLASTYEWIEIATNAIAARLEGRSSIGRLGITIHATASLIPPGWRGNIVLELSNIGRIPVALYPKMRICALTFERITTPVEIPYHKKKNAKYINQKGPLASKIHSD